MVPSQPIPEAALRSSSSQITQFRCSEIGEKVGAMGNTFKRGISCTLDAWVMAASVSGAEHPTCTRLWYIVPAILHRRQFHRLQASKGGERKLYGGTRSLGLKRGTVVRHPKDGLCTVGGFDRKRRTISLHDYRTN